MILPWLILIPFIGGFLCWIAEHSSKTLPRRVALLSMAPGLVPSLWVWAPGGIQLGPAPGGGPGWGPPFLALLHISG
ncbi:NADH-quinone oxidoreductase subunit M, partial [Pseudomonas aeruginosa]|nr:NADH-quinone oxidoreductase subunit M [Pseudomonas aeruginosa]